jgi:hypothetical protein
LHPWKPSVNGNVNTLALSGSTIFIGGNFTSIDGQERNRIAEVNRTTGALTSWNPDSDGRIRTILLDGGIVYVGGDFNHIGGESRNFIAALDATTGLATIWNPNASHPVFTLAASGTSVFAGGNFTSIGGQGRNHIAELNTTNDNATSWDPSANGNVRAMVIDGSSVYLGGHFTSIGGVPRNRIAEIPIASNNATAWNPNVSGVSQFVFSLITTSTSVYIGGSFNTVGGQSRNRIAEIDKTSGMVTPWSPNTTNSVMAMAEYNDKIYVGGQFDYIGLWDSRRHLAAIDLADGDLTTWDPNPNNTVWTLEKSGGNIYIGGDFSSIGGQSRSRIAAIEKATGLATTWAPNANARVRTIAMDGPAVYVGGEFTSIGGENRNRLAAIDIVSGMANLWDPDINNTVWAIKKNGSLVYVGGDFSNVGSDNRNRIAAIDVTSGIATTWDPNANARVRTIAMDGTAVFIGGEFTSIGGENRNRITAVDASDGSILNWNPNASGIVHAIALDGSNMYVGGQFASIGGLTRNRIAALDASTGALTAWNPNASGTVNTMAIRLGTIYVGGSFTTIGGQNRSRIAALSTTTGNATSWNPNANNTVLTIEIDGNTIYVGGSFQSIGGQPRGRIAALQTFSNNATTWNPNASGGSFVDVIKIQGSIAYVGGSFSAIGGQSRNNVAAIKLATGNATSWNPDVNNRVRAISVEGSTVYLGGTFSEIGGQTRNRLAAVEASTAKVLDWNPNANSAVHSIQKFGNQILVGGTFTEINGLLRGRIAALDPVTGVPASWGPNLNPTINIIYPSGSNVLVGGNFSSIKGEARQNFAVLNKNASVTVLASGGDDEGTTWSVVGNTISANSKMPIKLNVSDVLNKLAIGDLSIEGSDIIIEATIIDETSGNMLTLQANEQIVINQSIQCPSLILEAESATLKAGKYLQIDGDFVNNTGPSGLTMLADLNGYGQLKFSGNYSGSGQVSMKQYVTTTGWRNIANPFDNQIAGSFGLVGSDRHPNAENLKRWDANANYEWITIPDNNENLEPGRGYLGFFGTTPQGLQSGLGLGSGPWDLQMNGTPLTSASPTLYHNTSSSGAWELFTDPSQTDGWNLIANPFTSVLDFSTLTLPPHVNNAFYIWNPTKTGGAGYVSWSGAGISSPLIAPFQGFWIQTDVDLTNGTPLSMNMANHSIISTHSQPRFFKSEGSNFDRVVLSVQDKDKSEIEDYTVLALIAGTKHGYDPEWDAHKWLNPDTSLSIFSTFGHVRLANNAISHLPGSKSATSILIGFQTARSGSFKIAFDDQWMLNQYPIILEDLEKSVFHDLNKAPYSFTHQQSNNIRFKLHIGLELGQLKPSNPLDAWIWNGQIQLRSHTYAGPVDWVLVDMKGADVLRSAEMVEITIGEQLALPLHRKLPAGVYLLQVKTDEGFQHVKVVID